MGTGEILEKGSTVFHIQFEEIALLRFYSYANERTDQPDE